MGAFTSMSDRIVTAAVIIIGNEILSGRTQDTNLRDIALTLGRKGIRIAEARVLPDVEDVIVAAVNELRARHDYVLTTGGLGPTHDDITAACIAKAFGVELVEDPAIAAMLRTREAPPEVMAARLRMALVPKGAGLIENDAGSPPGFFIGNVYVLAGIPRIMRAMLVPLEKTLIGGAVVQSRSVIAYVGESRIAEPLRNVQALHPNVDIGSYPFLKDGRVGTTLVARGTDEVQLDEVLAQLERMLVANGVEPMRE
jgi:molybdenum cofactor synthesis domain-containing protein